MYIILREAAPTWRRWLSALSTVATVVQVIRTFRALAARSKGAASVIEDAEDDEDDEGDEDPGLRAAERDYLTVSLFLHGRENPLFELLDPSQLEELRRLRRVYLAGGWSLTGLDQKEWNAAGIDEPAMAVRLSSLGVRPSTLHGALTDEEGAAVTAACGCPVSAATPVELLDERRIDGPAMVAWLAMRRQQRLPRVVQG